MSFGPSVISKFVRAEENDPNRCQAVGGSGQCPYVAQEGSKYCIRHGANANLATAKAQDKRMYLSAKWSEKIGDKAFHPRIKSLREEIGILRMCLEEKLDICHDSSDLIIASGQISELALKIEKLIKTCHLVEKDSGFMMDIDQAKELGQKLLTIMTKYIDDSDVLNMIAEDIIELYREVDSQSSMIK